MKNKELLFDVIGDTDEMLIPEALVKKKINRTALGAVFGGLCAAVILVFSVLLINHNNNAAVIAPETTAATTSPTTVVTTEPEVTVTPLNANAAQLAAAVYPAMPHYPDEEHADVYEAWSNARRQRFKQAEENRNAFEPFFTNTSAVFLSGSGTENKVYSPLSLYMALSLCAEITDGNTRQQVLNVLAQKDIDTLRTRANSIWNANYNDDGMAKCVLANSLWTSNALTYKQRAIETLAENYYASVFSGAPGSEEYDRLLQDWLNEQTGGLLTDYVSGMKMTPDTVLALASTVNYSGKWDAPFSKEDTKKGTFHGAAGERQCDFMHAETITDYCRGKHFSSVWLRLEDNGEMRFLLPDEGVSPEELLTDEEALSYMMQPYSSDYEKNKYVNATVSVPKFDVSSDMDLTNGLQALGITDLFNGAADFSPLTDSAAFFGKAEQDTRVMIDEEGCQASSLTAMLLYGSDSPTENVEFTLDRPFVFEIVSDTGLPLFIGIVNQV